MKLEKCAFVILLLTLLVAASLSVPAANCQRPYETILVIPSATPSSFNPLMAFRDIGLARDWIYILYEPLILVTLNGTIVPWLAESWEILDGGTRYVFHIDPRAKWSDGVPVTAYDVEYTWNLTTTLAGGVTETAILQKVVAVDEYTVEFRTRMPYAYWPYSYGMFMPIPRHIWSQIPDPMSYDFIWNPENHVTSGPFLYDSFEEGQWYFFRTRPDYWKTEDKPRINGILRRVIMDVTLAVTGLLSGDLDLIEVGVDILPQVEGQPGISIYKFAPAAASDFLAINTRFYPLSMKEVRHAIDLAIDKKKIAQDYYWGQAIPANKSQINFELFPQVFVPEAVWPGFYKSHEECVAEANRILDSLGFIRGPDGIRVTPNGTRLSYTLIHEILFNYRLNAVEEIIKNLREIGIETTLQALNLFEWLMLTLWSDELLAMYGLTRDWGFSNGCFGEYTEPWYDLVYNYISAQASQPYGIGTGWLCAGTGWRSAECDEYGMRALLTLDKGEFFRNVKEMVRITADELPVVPTVWWIMTMFAYRTDKLVNWDFESCTRTPIFGHPLVVRPMTYNKLTPVTWVPTPTPPPTPRPTPKPTPTPTPTGPTPPPTPTPTPTGPTPTPVGPTPTGPTPTPVRPTPTPVVTPTPAPPAGPSIEQIILIAVVVIIVIAIIGYIAVRARKKPK